MLANRTLLSVTLAATFASGTFVGLAVNGQSHKAGVPPTDADAVYAPQLHELEVLGYDSAEMTDAREAYAEYLKGYGYWWTEFLDAHEKNLTQVDLKLEKRLAAVEARFRARQPGK